MSWQEVKARYRKRGGTSQSTEDMAARRVLHAIGLNGADTVFEAEKRLGINNSSDTTMLERAILLAERITGGVHIPVVFDAKTPKAAIARMAELAEAGHSDSLYRVKDGPLRAMVWLGCATSVDATSIPVPFSVQKCEESYVAECDAGEYITKLVRSVTNV